MAGKEIALRAVTSTCGPPGVSVSMLGLPAIVRRQAVELLARSLPMDGDAVVGLLAWPSVAPAPPIRVLEWTRRCECAGALWTAVTDLVDAAASGGNYAMTVHWVGRASGRFEEEEDVQ